MTLYREVTDLEVFKSYLKKLPRDRADDESNINYKLMDFDVYSCCQQVMCYVTSKNQATLKVSTRYV